MGVTKFPNGISSYGVPVMGNGTLPATTGTYYFVSSVTGSDGNNGKSAEQPFATIDKAINSCTANKADVIVVMPNHAETIADATSLVPDVAGISIIGLGNGTNQPEITFSATGSEIIIGAEDILIKNIRFIAGVSAVVTGIDVDANNFTLDGCTFDFSTTAFDFVLMVDIDALDNATIVNCKFQAENAVAGSNAAIRLDDANDVVIRGNYFSGDFAQAAIANVAADALGLNVLIADNIIYNDDTANAPNAIELANAYTGLICNNSIGSLEATSAAACIDPGSCLQVQNFACNAVNEWGIVVGAGAST